MVGVPLGQSTYRRRGARTADVAMTNVLLEKDATNQVDGLLRFQRPGLSQFAAVGTGPIRGVYRKLGVLESVYFVVSGQQLYSVTTSGVATLIGAVPGDDLVNMDGGPSKLLLAAGGTAYSTDGTTITQINMPDNVSVSSVAYVSGYFLLAQQDSERYYWLAPGDTDPDALNFASAENGPGNIVRLARLLDEIWAFKEQTTEVLQLTGNLDTPFQPIGGRLYEQGCANKDTVFTLDNTLFWIGTDLKAYRADTTPIRISDHSMEERLRVAGSDNLRAWAIALDGHTLYCVRVANVGTFVYDVENQNWVRFKTCGQDTWRAHIGTQTDGSLIIAGDDTDGILWKLDPDISNDNGDPLEREVTGGITVLGKPVKCRDFSVRVATGWAPITGTAADPKLQMRYSDDGGNIWSSWIEMPLGYQGQYLTEVVWRQLGLMSDPGRLFTVRMTDDTIFRISFARMNEASSI